MIPGLLLSLCPLSSGKLTTMALNNPRFSRASSHPLPTAKKAVKMPHSLNGVTDSRPPHGTGNSRADKALC